jgi:uncharacterized membrane protein
MEEPASDIRAIVSESTSSGATPEEVYLQLLQEGHTVEEISGAYAEIRKADRAPDTRSRAVRVIVVAGAVLIGAGVFSFVAANWGSMGASTKVAVIVAGMVVASAAGWYLAEQRSLRSTGGALLLLGSVIFGAGIFLVAQIFNLRGNWPDGYVLWAVGTLAMAMATRVRVLFALGLAVGLVGLAGYPLSVVDPLPFSSGPLSGFLTPFWLPLLGAAAACGAALVLRAAIPASHRDRW